MLRLTISRKFFAPIWGVVYLFVILFSQYFHQHGSGEAFQDFKLKKSEKSYVTDTQVENLTDCLSCHLLHAGNSLVPQDHYFHLLKIYYFQKELFSFQQRFASSDFFNFQLRGPPAFFI